MKKTAIISGTVLLVVLTALPVLAQGRGVHHGWGMGPGYGQMMGPGGWGPGWAGLSEEKAKALSEAQTKFFEETLALRQQAQLKRAELRALFLNPEAKQEDLLAKHNELKTLTNELSQKRLLFTFEMREKFPELAGSFGGWFGGGWGQGYGPMMGPGYGHMMAPGYGPMMGPGHGWGSGGCW